MRLPLVWLLTMPWTLAPRTVETILGSRTATQLGYLDATSSIQTQLDARITESAVALLIAAAADDLQDQLDAIDTRLTNAGF